MVRMPRDMRLSTHFHIGGATVVCALPTDIIISKSIEILCSHFTQLPSKIMRGGGRLWGGSVTAWTNKVTGMLCTQRLHRFDYGPICQLGDWIGSVWKLFPVVCISFIISPLLTMSLQGWHSISNAPWPLSLRHDTTKSMVDLEVLYSCEGWQSLDYIDCTQKWLQICVCLTNSASTNLHCHPAGGKWDAHSLHRGKGWSSSAWLEICYWCTAPWPHFPSRAKALKLSLKSFRSDSGEDGCPLVTSFPVINRDIWAIPSWTVSQFSEQEQRWKCILLRDVGHVTQTSNLHACHIFFTERPLRTHLCNNFILSWKYLTVTNSNIII